jgi:hypothetical protein
MSCSFRGEPEQEEDLRTGVWGVWGVRGEVDWGERRRTVGSHVLALVGVCVFVLLTLVVGVFGLKEALAVPGAARFNNLAHVTTLV